MIELNPMQAKIYEWLREGYSIREIARVLGHKETGGAKIYVNQLEELGALKQRGKDQYVFLVDQYSVGWKNVKSRSTVRRIKLLLENMPDIDEIEKIVLRQPTYQVKLTEKQREIIEKLYKKVPRSKIAETVGVPKFDLNMALIQMGLGE